MPYEDYITCIDRNGEENIFRYDLKCLDEHGMQNWIFRVMPEDLNAADWFEFIITRVNETTGKITVMDNRGMPQYIAKGIPEKLIEIASEVLDLEISSSSNNPRGKSFDPEWRSPAAEKVWLRLIEREQAVYNEETDIYLYIPN